MRTAKILTDVSATHDEGALRRPRSFVSRSMMESCNAVRDVMQELSDAAQQNAANTEETTASIEQVLSMTEQIAAGITNIRTCCKIT